MPPHLGNSPVAEFQPADPELISAAEGLRLARPEPLSVQISPVRAVQVFDRDLFRSPAKTHMHAADGSVFNRIVAEAAHPADRTRQAGQVNVIHSCISEAMQFARRILRSQALFIPVRGSVPGLFIIEKTVADRPPAALLLSGRLVSPDPAGLGKIIFRTPAVVCTVRISRLLRLPDPGRRLFLQLLLLPQPASV